MPGTVTIVLVLAVLVRLHSASSLWLDESLSVNIARLPLHELPAALREDGSPPLYYLLLHGWIAVFGSGTTAVRALSGLFALAALPLIWLLARQVADRTAAWAAVLLLGTSPFAVRYATETRMYALVVTLVLAGGCALVAALARPTVLRLAGLAASSGALLLTHYWSLYLLTTTGVVLIGMSVWGPDRRAARRCVVGTACGGLFFLPWLPSFFFQLRHTGTPWAAAPSAAAVLQTIGTWAGGTGSFWGGLLLLVLTGLVVAGILGRQHDGGLLLGRPVAQSAAAFAGVSVGTLALGIGLAAVTTAGYSTRYSAAALGPFLLVAAMGAAAVPGRARTVLVALAVAAGLGGSVTQPFSTSRTEAPLLASALRSGLAPGALVVYCPDQLGPAVSRLLPAGVDQVVYPTMGRPDRVDWVDYAQRNRRASPAAFAEQLLSRSAGPIWLVSAGHYRTYGRQCQDLDALLAQARGGRVLVVPTHRQYGEAAQLTRYDPPAGAASAGH